MELDMDRPKGLWPNLLNDCILSIKLVVRLHGCDGLGGSVTNLAGQCWSIDCFNRIFDCSIRVTQSLSISVASHSKHLRACCRYAT